MKLANIHDIETGRVIPSSAKRLRRNPRGPHATSLREQDRGQRWYKGTDSQYAVMPAEAEHLTHPQLIDLSDFVRLRGRCRWVMQNKPMAKSIERNYQAALVGRRGPRLEVMVDDTEAAAMIKAAWMRWSGNAEMFDFRRRDNLAALLRIAVSTLLSDGDIFVRIRPGKPISVELVDPGRLNLRAQTQDRNTVMSVELDEFLRPSAYWINELKLGYRSSTSYYDSTNSERVPVADILHFADKYNPDQVRGVPLLAPLLVNLHIADEFSSSVLQNALLGSNHWLTIQSGDQDDLPRLNSESEPEEIVTPGAEGEPDRIVEVDTIYNDRVSVVSVGQGSVLGSIDKKFPDQATGPFLDAANKLMSAGSSVPYHLLMNDYSGVNYSSAKAADVLYKQYIGGLFAGIESAILSRLYRRWLRQATLDGTLNLSPAALSNPSLYDHRFRPEMPASIDPHRDAQTNEMNLKNGLATKAGILMEKGVDPEAFAKEQEYSDEVLGGQAMPPAPAPAAPQMDQAEN